MLQEAPRDLSGMPREGASPQLLRERCDFAYRRLVPAAGGTLAVSLILSAFLWRSQPAEVVLSWQALMVVLASFIAGLSWAYRRATDHGKEAATWARRLAIGAAALGAGWGYGAAVFFPGGVDQQVFLSFIVAVVTPGAPPSFSPLRLGYRIYA